ncbi:MAG: RNase adapter RapZ [Proteobacteria bacterium]|nr:RNase adapter RapZ [Pseudomonadota bacterium]
MKVFLVTGVSGAGKTIFVKALEDIGYFCVDNLPVPLLDSFFDLLKKEKRYVKVAVVVDIREKFYLNKSDLLLKNIKKKIPSLKIVFLDARDEVLIRRFNETRRKHPLNSFDIISSIDEERKILSLFKKEADYIIDTSTSSNYDLRKKAELISEGQIEPQRIQLKIISFGFKFGIPIEADNIFDVRFIPNPYYVQELKDKTGLDKDVISFIEQKGVTADFLKKLRTLLPFMIKNYDKEGKNFISFAFGCTGGKHRSVYIANYFYDYLRQKYKNISVFHRDLS